MTAADLPSELLYKFAGVVAAAAVGIVVRLEHSRQRHHDALLLKVGQVGATVEAVRTEVHELRAWASDHEARDRRSFAALRRQVRELSERQHRREHFDDYAPRRYA